MENQQARPSQVDHVNKQLLLRFKQHLDENSFEIPSEAQAIVEVEEASWVDDDEDYDPDDYKPCGKTNQHGQVIEENDDEDSSKKTIIRALPDSNLDEEENNDDHSESKLSTRHRCHCSG